MPTNSVISISVIMWLIYVMWLNRTDNTGIKPYPGMVIVQFGFITEQIWKSYREILCAFSCGLKPCPYTRYYYGQ